MEQAHHHRPSRDAGQRGGREEGMRRKPKYNPLADLDALTILIPLWSIDTRNAYDRLLEWIKAAKRSKP
jgi:hypothetical protein